MTRRLTPSLQATLDAIRAHVAEHGQPPMLRELATARGMSTVAIHSHVHALERKRLLAVERQKWRGIRLFDPPAGPSSCVDGDGS